MNDPPTAVGGIIPMQSRLFCRLDLNDPPASVGGILSKALDAEEKVVLYPQSPRRESGDFSDPTYKQALPNNNPPDGSRGIVQIQPTPQSPL